MEISELDPQLKDTQDELIMHQQKTQKFKEYVPVSYTHLTLPTNREV